MTGSAQRYTAVAIVLHWAIAFAILYMIVLGFWMGDQVEHHHAGEGVFRAFQLHKSIGLTILLLSMVRLGWRLTHRVPPLPTHMPGWEKFAALATHWAFYFFMIAMPLTGWLYVSTQWSAPTDQPLPVATHYFGLFRVPALFGIAQQSEGARQSLSHLFLTWHWAMAWLIVALAALHVAAALKHQIIDRDETLAHMVPGLKAPNESEPPPKSSGRLAVLGGGLSLAAVAAIAMLYAATTFSAGAAAPPQTTSTVTLNTPSGAGPVPAPQAPVAPVTTTTATAPTPPAATASSTWRVNTASSSIGFSFVYNDEENGPHTFNGRFSRWRADIRFDPNDLPHSSANVTIEVASASDNVEIHDQYLPTAPWFNAAAQPTATFRTTSIAHRGAGYVAQGTLTIRGQSKPITLPFTLTITGNRAVMSGHASIDRHDFGIGVGADSEDVISRNIDINVRVTADRS